MEQATRWASGAWTLRGGSELAEVNGELPGAGNLAALRSDGDEIISIDTETAAPNSEWSTALDLVQEACAALRSSEERIEQLEAEAEQNPRAASARLRAAERIEAKAA